MTTINESAVQTAVAVFIRTLTEFADADVVINDYSILDGSIDKFPVVIVTTADNFRATPATGGERNDFFEVPVVLYEKFIIGKDAAGKGWQKSLDNLRDRRQAIVDKVFTGSNSSIGTAGLKVNEVRNEGPIDSLYNPKLNEVQLKDAMPIMLSQTIIISLESF